MTEHKGFRIHPRKKLRFPWYYAWVYSANGDRAGVKVERDDEAPTRDRIIECAKWEIDEGIIS